MAAEWRLAHSSTPSSPASISSTSDFIHVDVEAAHQNHAPLALDGLEVGALPLESLDNHPAFRFEKVSFLMDAAAGFANINQNMITKIFSVASLATVPMAYFTNGEWLR